MRIIMIAGSNGAGKTTFARDFLARAANDPAFINGDDIAKRLNPGDPAAVAQKAGRMAIREMEALVARRADFVTETTLSGRGYAKRIRRWQAAGYRVSIIFLRLSSADQTVRRVARRVSEGGHDIPEDVARRRFERSWANFRNLYREIADDWQVYDNSGEVAVLLAQSEGWQEVREPRSDLPDRAYRVEDQRTSKDRRAVMSKQQWNRIPEGEPSVKSVLASLKEARKVAMARQEAVRRGEPVYPPHHGPWDGYEVEEEAGEESVDGAASEVGKAVVRGGEERDRSAERAGAGAGGRGRGDG